MSGITSLCFDTKTTEGIENSDLGSEGFLPQEGHVQDVGSHTDSHARAILIPLATLATGSLQCPGKEKLQ